MHYTATIRQKNWSTERLGTMIRTTFYSEDLRLELLLED
jgi:hypothetical protein